MHLREASNGGSILEVEKRLLNQQKKAEEKRKRQEKDFKTSRAASVFDIINSKLNSNFSKFLLFPALGGYEKTYAGVS